MARTAAIGLAVLLAAGMLLAARRMRPIADVVTVPGMVFFPGGRTRIGSDAGEAGERPSFDVDVAPFLLDVHPVTVGEFARFVAATGFTTESDRLGSSGVFDPASGTWSLVEGADWRRPRGPDAPPAPADHPVTQVSWNDAQAYCAWAGKRLPSEIEWEHAARNGRNGGPQYAWGDALVVAGRFMANTWQGHFPERNTIEDGYLYTSPVGEFGVTPRGLTDMGGNVWQWCADWYRPYGLRDQPFTPRRDSEKVMRGGSFLCDPKVCHGFRVSARGHSTPETGLMHVGFRCARGAHDEAPRVRIRGARERVAGRRRPPDLGAAASRVRIRCGGCRGVRTVLEGVAVLRRGARDDSRAGRGSPPSPRPGPIACTPARPRCG